MNYKVYKIQRIDTNEIVYIGITRNTIEKRFKGHLREKKRNLKKIRYFSKYGSLLQIICIEDNINNLKEANQKEIYYIKKYRDLDCNLLNATDGGDGTLNFKSWNKGIKCTYIDKLIKNSPNAKNVYSYDLTGVFLKEYNSIKKASEDTNIPRYAIKNICDLKKGFISYKNISFRYFKKEKINIKRVSESERIKNVALGKLKNSKKVIIFDKLNNKEYLFNNYLDCINYFKFNKKTLFTYLSISKETKKYKFNYE
jgi:predicted GIY-YIG superfamily endonuclease